MSINCKYCGEWIEHYIGHKCDKPSESELSDLLCAECDKCYELFSISFEYSDARKIQISGCDKDEFIKNIFKSGYFRGVNIERTKNEIEQNELKKHIKVLTDSLYCDLCNTTLTDCTC